MDKCNHWPVRYTARVASIDGKCRIGFDPILLGKLEFDMQFRLPSTALCLCYIVLGTSNLVAADESINGVWVNVDSETAGLTKFVIQDKNGTTTIRAWGSCSPEDCDWGSTPFHRLGDSAGAKTVPFGFATWEKGFSTSHCSLEKKDKNVVTLTVHTIFKDSSKRTNYRVRYTFRPAKGEESVIPPEKKKG